MSLPAGSGSTGSQPIDHLASPGRLDAQMTGGGMKPYQPEDNQHTAPDPGTQARSKMLLVISDTDTFTCNPTLVLMSTILTSVGPRGGEQLIKRYGPFRPSPT
ncbi:unnamed protein product [Merluccius merluccius]